MAARTLLIERAYAASGYAKTSDKIVIRDRVAALEKKSDQELERIIAKQRV